MAQLIWRRAKDLAQLPAHTSLKQGSGVRMEGRRYDALPLPGSFNLYRVYSPIMRAAARAVGKPPYKQPGDVYGAVVVGSNTARTEQFPLAPGFWSTQRWRFTDPSGNWSTLVRTARFSDIRLKGHVDTPPGFPVGLAVDAEVTVPTGLDDPLWTSRRYRLGTTSVALAIQSP